MTEREALIQLATPEPDYPVKTAEWQEWRDRTTEALKLAHRARAARPAECSSELVRGMRHAAMTARSTSNHGYAEQLEQGAAEIERLRTAIERVRNEAPNYIKTLVRDV